mmetsp:Transcript_44751/g.83596  ORF Transcript_44751/g.83596 Transcript_44751/m.83596 type:complete len:103 (+) Transcript_44751:56-364(+)
MALQLRIHLLSGKLVMLTVSSIETVADVVARVTSATEKATGDNPDVRLSLASGDTLTLLEESKTLSDCGIVDGATLLARRSHHVARMTYELKSEPLKPMFWQ